MDLNRSVCYRAVAARDARFDGLFFTCVRSTGVYCRPICPAPRPRLDNCLFVPTAAAAQAAGFRPCLRCRPELSPQSPGRRGSARTVTRAMALIAGGALDGASVETLAERVGVGSRQLRRLFLQHLGASPRAVAQTRRLLFAKKLLAETDLPMTEVAHASGYGSVRRFNTAIRQSFDQTPRALRQGHRRPAARDGRAARIDRAIDRASGKKPGGVTLKLAFRPPYDWAAAVAFLAPRATPGVEAVSGDRYARTFTLRDQHGVIEVRPASGRHHLRATIAHPDVAALPEIALRLTQLFDLDANPAAIAGHLQSDPRLEAALAQRPGLRVVGAWDRFEVAVRAILGQQVTVKAATTIMARLVATCGHPLTVAGDLDAGDISSELSRVFPDSRAVAAADLSRLGIPRQRAKALQALATAVAEDGDFLASMSDLDHAIARLRELPGIGDWTAHYIALRALGEPDAFPASDLGLRRALSDGDARPTAAEVSRMAQNWRPWRAYAAMHLWLMNSKTPQSAT